VGLGLDEVEDEVSSVGEGEGRVGFEEKSVEVLRGRKRRSRKISLSSSKKTRKREIGGRRRNSPPR